MNRPATWDVGELAEQLHAAADRIGQEPPNPEWEALADAAGRFMEESAISTEDGVAVVIAGPSAIGYGVMLGWVARASYTINAKESSS